jgi:peptidoglycan/LPS O-acetylase OafA/YrhL
VKERIPTLDGLRGLAVLLVVWQHLPRGLLGPAGDALRFAVQPGYLGVDLFFVLSGFLITRILLADRARRRPLRHFLVRRFARIFPIYYLLILAMWWLEPGSHLAWCAAYLSNFYFALHREPSPMEHTWSLAVEEHFYLVWPLAVGFLPVASSRRLALFGILPAAVLLALATAALEPWLPAEADGIIYRVTWYRMLSLGLGALFAFGERELRAEPARPWRVALRFLLPALAVLPGALLVDHRWVGPLMLVGFSLLSSAIFLAGLGANATGGLPARLLTLSPLCFAGRISYGFYLYHLPIFTAFGVYAYPKDQPPPLALTAAALGVSLLAAAASFYAIERPILRLTEPGRALAGRSGGLGAPAGAPSARA